MYRTTKLKITDLNPHLVCTLCGGYFIDATTIIECLHSFCRSCIVKYLENNKFCPVCEVQVHKTRPLLNIRSDQTLQDIVYKLVPGLYKNEMSLRREFYAKHKDAAPANPEDRGETLEKFVYSPDETISLSLEYTADSAYKDKDQDLENVNPRSRRFLRCPAAVTVALLKKLIRGKFGLQPSHPLDLIFGEDTLSDEYSLVDIAYIYLWRRKGPMSLKYRIYEIVTSSPETRTCETIKSESIEIDSVIAKNNNEEKDLGTGTQSLPIKDPELSLKGVKCSVPAKAVAESDADSATEPWKEVQLKISESGVMSVLNVEVCLPPSSNASDSDVLATVLSSGKSKDVRSSEDTSANSAKGNRDTKKSTSGKNSQAGHGTELANKKQVSAPSSGTLKTSKAQSKPTNLATSRVATTNHAPNSAPASLAVKRTFSAMESSAPSSLPTTSASSPPISQPSAPKAPRFFKARNANAQPQSKPAHTYQSTFSSIARNKDKNKASKTNKLQAVEVSKGVEPPLLPKELGPISTPTTCQAPIAVTHSLSQEATAEMNANSLPRMSGDLLPAKPKDIVRAGGKETPPKNDTATKAKNKVDVASETKKVAPQHVELVIPKVPEVFNLSTTPCTSATESPTSKTARPPTPLYSSANQGLTNASVSTSRASSPSIPRPSSAPAVPKPGQRRPMITRPLTPGPLSLTANGKSAKPVEPSLSSDSRSAEPARSAQSPLSSPVATNCSPLLSASHGWLSPPLPGTSRSNTNLSKPSISPSLVAPQSPSHLSALQQHHALTRSSLSFLPRGPLPAHLFPNFIHPPHLPYVPSASHLHLSQASLNSVGKLGNIGEVATSSNATMTAAPPSSTANQTSPKGCANAAASNSGTNLLPNTTSVAWSVISRPQASPSHYSLSSLMATPVMSLPDHLGLTSFAKSLNTALLSPLSREAQNQQRIMEALTGSLFNFSATYPELLQATGAAAALPKADPKLKATRPADNLASRPSITSPLTHPYFGYGYHSSLPPTVTTLANIRSHDLRSTTSTTTPVTSTKPLASRRPPPLVPLAKKSQSATAAQKETSGRQDSSSRNSAATVSSPPVSKDERNSEEKTSSRDNCATDLSSQSKLEENERARQSQGEGSGTDVLTGGVSVKTESAVNGEVAKDVGKVSGVEDLSGCNGAARDSSVGKISKLPLKEGSTAETSAD